MPGTWQILIIVVLVVLLFGRGKISSLMGDVAKGITSFRKGMKEGEADVSKPDDPKIIENNQTAESEQIREKEKSDI